MTRITIINFHTRLNKGSTALLNSMMNTLNAFLPETKFTIFSYHTDYNQFPVEIFKNQVISLNLLQTFETLVVLLRCWIWSVINRYSNKNVHFLINNKKLKRYYYSDIIINTGGDGLTEDYGSPFSYFSNILIAILLGKPVVIYAESIGPFKKYWNKIIANLILNRVKLITLREEKSKEHLDAIGVTKPSIFITADSAFLLESATQQDIKNILRKEGIHKSGNPLIGLSVSKIISNYGFLNHKCKRTAYEEYVKIMAKVVKYLIENLNATVVFIPHVIIPHSDDRHVAEDILNLLNNENNVISIKNEYTPEELKGIIGHCDLFIGARMHACIASTSMLVPTIAIAYSHKTHWVIGKMLNQEKYVIDIKDFSYDLVLLKVKETWREREKIKRELGEKIPLIKEKAILNCVLVKEILNTEGQVIGNNDDLG